MKIYVSYTHHTVKFGLPYGCVKNFLWLKCDRKGFVLRVVLPPPPNFWEKVLTFGFCWNFRWTILNHFSKQIRGIFSFFLSVFRYVVCQRCRRRRFLCVGVYLVLIENGKMWKKSIITHRVSVVHIQKKRVFRL